MHTMKLDALVGMLILNAWCICTFFDMHSCGLRIFCSYIHAILMLY
jgi:hypothetical protein